MKCANRKNQNTSFREPSKVNKNFRNRIKLVKSGLVVKLYYHLMKT